MFSFIDTQGTSLSRIISHCYWWARPLVPGREPGTKSVGSEVCITVPGPQTTQEPHDNVLHNRPERNAAGSLYSCCHSLSDLWWLERKPASNLTTLCDNLNLNTVIYNLSEFSLIHSRPGCPENIQKHFWLEISGSTAESGERHRSLEISFRLGLRLSPLT